MWGGSTRLFACLTKNHHIIRTKAEILVDGIVELVVYGKTIVDQSTGQATSLLNGGVSVQRNEVRREAETTFLDLSQTAGDLTPTDASDLFAPARSEFRLYRGYQYHDATEGEIASGLGVEYWPVGTFITSYAKMSWPGVYLHGYDRLWGLRGGFQRPYPIAAGTPNMEALDTLLRLILKPGQQDISLPTSNHTTPTLVWDPQDKQLTRAHDLAIADGRVLYADQMGTIRAVDETVADASLSVWTFQPGRFNIGGQPERELDVSDSENVVIANGESDGTVPPVSGRAADNNPASFTYVGKTPEVPFFFSSPLLKTVDQCNKAAQTILNRQLGVADTVVIPTIPLPGLESGDVIQVVDGKTKLDSYLIADAFNIPLNHDGVMSIDCRTQMI